MTAAGRMVVLFGASGFIGRNIVDRLAQDGAIVHGVTGSGRPVDGCAAVTTFDALDSLPALPADTVLINVAAFRYDAGSFAADQQAAFETNTRIVNRVYAFALARGLKEVRFASSSAVYPASWDLLDEDRTDPFGGPPHAGEFLYAWSKRWGELAADHHQRNSGISTLSFRLSNPYGPHDTLDINAAHVATAFVIRALEPGPTFAIRGNSSAERDFLFAGDIAEVFARSLILRGVHDACNLAYGETCSVLGLARKALAAAGSSKRIETAAPAGGAGVAVRKLNVGRLERHLGPVPFRTLDEGLRLTMDWYRHALRTQ